MTEYCYTYTYTKDSIDPDEISYYGNTYNVKLILNNIIKISINEITENKENINTEKCKNIKEKLLNLGWFTKLDNNKIVKIIDFMIERDIKTGTINPTDYSFIDYQNTNRFTAGKRSSRKASYRKNKKHKRTKKYLKNRK